MSERTPPGNEPDAPRQAIEQIEKALRGLRFGQVTVVVQDGVVVQVERTERIRMSRRTRALRREE